MTSVHMGIGKQEMVLVLKGHAGYKDGEDIVCAALSILGQAAVATVLDMQQGFGVQAKVDIQPGVLKMSAEYPEQVQKEIESRMTLAKNGFRMLEQVYPEHVKCNLLAVQTKNDGM